MTTLKRSKILATGQSVDPKTSDVEYHINGERSITISGDVRETVHDVLFEENIDEMSITTMILETIINVSQLPIFLYYYKFVLYNVIIFNYRVMSISD